MITQSLMDAFSSILVALIGTLPTFSLPDWWDVALGYWSSMISVATQLQYWIPFPALGDVALLIFYAIAFAVAVKAIRIVASFFTLGGGSAA